MTSLGKSASGPAAHLHLWHDAHTSLQPAAFFLTAVGQPQITISTHCKRSPKIMNTICAAMHMYVSGRL